MLSLCSKMLCVLVAHAPTHAEVPLGKETNASSVESARDSFYEYWVRVRASQVEKATQKMTYVSADRAEG